MWPMAASSSPRETRTETDLMNPWISRNLLFRPAALVRGEPTFALLRRYEESQWWDRQRIDEMQNRALERILRHALKSTGYYGRMAANVGIDPATATADDLTRLPLLDKTQLVDAGNTIHAPRMPGTTSWKTTGGSTGVAVRLRKNRYATAAEQAASWRSYGWYGIEPGARQARFWGTPLRRRARLRYHAIDFVFNRERFSAFAFDDEDLGHYFRGLEARPPVWVYGYVSMLVQFAGFCQREKLDLAGLGITAIVTTSEVLSESDRKLLQASFGAPVYNEYGCGEVGAVMYECERGTLHSMAENLFLESVPDPTEDEPGACRLIVTDLHNLATPLLRYDLGDRAVPAGACACGRELPGFTRVFGRAYDFVSTSDGRNYHGEFFLYAVEAARDGGVPIQQVQFVQTGGDEIEMRVVANRGYREEHGRAMAKQLEIASGGRLRFEVTEVEGIERERSGKIRLIKRLDEA
jgi:phenylacetate-CoA ligase